MKTTDIDRKLHWRNNRPEQGPVNPDVKAIDDAVRPLLDWAHNARIALRKLRYRYGHVRRLPHSERELEDLYRVWEEDIRDGHRLAKRAMIMFAERLAKQERDASGR